MGELKIDKIQREKKSYYVIKKINIIPALSTNFLSLFFKLKKRKKKQILKN